MPSPRWRDLGSLDNCILGAQNWFSQSVDRVVRNGSSTLFWHDLWTDSVPLSVKFQRLYSMSKEKMVTVDSIGSWSEDTWKWNFSWRRRFFEWEQDLFDQFMQEIQKMRMKQGVQDSCNWNPSISGAYSVKSGYSLLVSDSVSSGVPRGMRQGGLGV